MRISHNVTGFGKVHEKRGIQLHSDSDKHISDNIKPCMLIVHI